MTSMHQGSLVARLGLAVMVVTRACSRKHWRCCRWVKICGAYLREACLEQAQPLVVWPEIMTPLHRANTRQKGDRHDCCP